MPRLSFFTFITAILTAALAAVSLALLLPAYQGSRLMQDEALQRAHDKESRVLQQLIDRHLQDVSRTAATLAESPPLLEQVARRDLDAARQLLENALLHRAGDHIQALVIQLSDGPLALVPGPALFNIYLPLSQLASRPVQTDSWSYVGTRQNGRAYHLLRHSLPIIGEPYGAVQGYLHAFVLLNDNFPLLSQIQILSGADTVGLYAGHAPIGLLGAASDRQQALDTINPASPISVTANGTVQQYPLALDPAGRFSIRLLSLTSTGPSLPPAGFRSLGYGLAVVLLIGTMLALALYRFGHRPLRQLIRHVEAVAAAGNDDGFPRTRFTEFNRLGRALEAMQQRIQDQKSRLASTLPTEQTLCRQQLAQLKVADRVFASTSEAILVLDPGQRILSCNDAYRRLTGYSEQQALQQPLALLTEHSELARSLEHDGQWQGEAQQRRADGQSFPVRVSATRLEAEPGDERRYLVLFSDMSPMKNAERRLEFMSRYDTLTGLPNRQLFFESLAQVLARCERAARGAALLFIDLDRFKNINETLGLAGGDDLLQQVARRLADCLRPGDSLARLGSDEFCILLPDLGQVTASQNVARRIQQGFQAPFQLGDEEVHVTCTIGIALYPDDTGDAPTLLRQADTAAHHAKRHGRNAIQYFDDGINREAQQRLQLNEGLRRALGSDELFVEYQPRYDISGLKVLGAEALVRWRHPEQGLVSPMTFIPLAEESGLILELGGQVLRQACVAAQQWNRDSLTPVPVSVNLSPRQLRDPDLIGAVCDALQHSGLPPELLELEITETVVIEDINRVLGTLHELRDMGISISVDDFGTGYSSLIYLKKLPVDTVKIDRSFVNDVPGSTDDEYLIEAIISMAHSLRLRVVAEGVETEEQRAFLQRLGCDELQGYLLGRPGSAETMIGLTRDRSRDGASRKLPRLLGEH